MTRYVYIALFLAPKSCLMCCADHIQLNTQPIPPPGPLIAQMPTGREIHTDRQPFKPPVLDRNALDSMRVPPDRSDDFGDAESSDEEERTVVGAYPEFGRSGSAGYY